MGDTKKKEGLEEQNQNMPTRGEQCMLVMILTTLIFFLLLLIVFAIHLALVKHTVNDIFRAWNYDNDVDNKYEVNCSEWGKSDQSSEYTNKGIIEPVRWLDTTPVLTNTSESDALFEIKNAVIGIVYLNISSPRVLCNALRINEKWSLVPGYCAALWSDPYLTEYIPAWLTRYYLGQDFIASVTGSQSLPNLNSRRHFKTEILYRNSIDAKLPLTMEVKRMSYEDCLSIVHAVASPRNYEICYEFAVKSGSCIDNGGFLQEDYRIIGLFSWMNRCPDMDLPFVVITLHSYKRWIADTTALSRTFPKNGKE